MVTINGEKKEVDGIVLSKYLEAAEYKAERIAVELNGNILPKSVYAQTTLCNGDIVEIVSFVGGG